MDTEPLPSLRKPLIKSHSQPPALREHDEISIPPLLITPSSREFKDMLIFGSPPPSSSSHLKDPGSNLFEALTLTRIAAKTPISSPDASNSDQQTSNSESENQQTSPWLIDPDYPASKSNLHRSKTAPAMANINEIDHSPCAKQPQLGNVSVVKQGALLLIVYLSLGVAIYSLNRDNFRSSETHPVVDALSFCVVTMCTIGYGDITPDSIATKVFSILFVLVGFGFIDILLSGMVSYMLDLQESYLLKHTDDPGSYIFDLKKGRMRIRMKVGLALGVVVLCIGVGAAVMYFVEKLDLLDSVYLSVMSVTTVGYGDRAFKSLKGRVFACIWLLVSTLAVAKAFLYLAEARVNKRHRVMAKWVLGQDMTVAQFLAADIDNNGFVRKHLKLLEKYSKVEEIKNKFRDCTALVQGKYDAIEKEYGAVKKLEELKVQVNILKDKEEEKCVRCIDLDDEVSALNEEVRLLKQNHESASQGADKEIRERLNASEKEIKCLKELLDKERQRAAAEKKNAELEKKISEVEKVANVERKKAEENRLLREKIKTEADAMKLMLDSERSKTEAAGKKVEAEKQNAIRERKRADLAEARYKEQLELVETHLKKAMFEKSRADELNQKLEEARIKAEKLEELNKRLCAERTVEAQGDKSKFDKASFSSSDYCVGLPKKDAQMSKRMEKIIMEKEHIINREKRRADSAKKKAKKRKKVSEAYEKLAMEQKHRADQLFDELESYKVRLKELQELQELDSRRIYADNAPLRNNEVITEADPVKQLKKRLKLEKMLVKHASETAKAEALRSNMLLHRELFHLKQESHLFQQRLEFLDKRFFHDLEGTHKLEKICIPTSIRETLCSDREHMPLVSGIDSGLDTPYKGSNQETLKSSAINSSSTSFSDRTLMGSQERRNSSIITSDRLGEDISNLKPTIPRLSDKRSMRYNEHHTVDKANDNSVRNPGKDNENEKRAGHSGKKRILDAVELIENLNSKVTEPHQHVLEKQTHMPEDFLKENSSRKFIPPSKRRKTSCEGMISIHHLHESGQPKILTNLGTDHPGDDVMLLGGNQLLPLNFDEIAAYDYTKLLDLDGAEDESSYRKAIANPLSPMLPEVEIHEDGELVVDNPEMPAPKNSPEGSFNVRDNPASVSNFRIVDMEKNPSSLVLNSPVDSQLQSTEESVDQLKSKDSVLVSDTLLNQIHVASGALGMPDVLGSGNKETNITCKRGLASSDGCLLGYFVVSSNYKDNASISRILQTMDSCKPLCSFLHSPEIYLQGILDALSKAEDLSMKEKACVFFSIVLNRISEVGIRNLTDFSNDELVQSYDSMTQRIHSELSGPVLRKIFTESCDLLELFAVIENFILQRKVFTCGEAPVSTNGFKLNLVLNGIAITLSEVVPPSHLLIAGGTLLASFCSAVNHIGFICEISFNIITMQDLDRPVMLAILHAFARACGSEYFTLQQYSMAMTVVKSLVTFLEKVVEDKPEHWLCSKNCPFSEDALSMVDVASFLLEKLWNIGNSNYSPNDLLLGSTSDDENAYNFTDILSLVEVLSSFMICEHLESHITAAVIVLLGQLGRFGVDASGYEDGRVEKLRGWLSALACEVTFVKLDLSVQFAVISSLFCLTRIKFEDVVDGRVETTEAVSGFVPASLIREWFFGMSDVQKSDFRVVEAVNEEC